MTGPFRGGGKDPAIKDKRSLEEEEKNPTAIELVGGGGIKKDFFLFYAASIT